MDALWSASTIKVIGSGIDDPDFADKLSRLIGDHEVRHRLPHPRRAGHLHHDCHSHRTRPAPRRRSVPCPRAQGLLLATGLPVALLALRPWYREPDADTLAAASQRQTNQITHRVLNDTPAPNRDDYREAA